MGGTSDNENFTPASSRYNTPPSSPPQFVRDLAEKVAQNLEDINPKQPICERLTTTEYEQLEKLLGDNPRVEDKLRLQWIAPYDTEGKDDSDNTEALGQLIINMPTLTHEKMIDKVMRYFRRQLDDEAEKDDWLAPLEDLEGNRNGEILFYPEGQGVCKLAPDDSLSYDEAPFPVFYLEVVFSTNRDEARERARIYLKGSRGVGRVVVLIDVEYRNKSDRATRTEAPPAWYAVFTPVQLEELDKDGKPLLDVKEGKRTQFRGPTGAIVGPEESLVLYAAELLPNPTIIGDADYYKHTISITHTRLCAMVEKSYGSHRVVETYVPVSPKAGSRYKRSLSPVTDDDAAAAAAEDPNYVDEMDVVLESDAVSQPRRSKRLKIDV
jgi:hypothetical protein